MKTRKGGGYLLAAACVVLVLALAGAALASHGLDNAADKADEHANLPTLQSEHKQANNEGGPGSQANGPNHGSCVSRAAHEARDLLAEAGADLSEDPWRKGLFVSSVARTDHEITTTDCDRAIEDAVQVATSAAGAGNSDDAGDAGASAEGQGKAKGKGKNKGAGEPAGS